MDIFIANKSALRLIRLIRQGNWCLKLEPTSVTRVSPLPSTCLSIDRLGLAPLCSLMQVTDTAPLQLLAPNRSGRRKARGIRLTMRSTPWGPAPYMQVVPTSDDAPSPLILEGMRVFVESPASVVLSMAYDMQARVRDERQAHLTATLKLLKLTLELCGTFTLDPFQPLKEDARYFVPPVLSIGDLAKSVAGTHKILGLPLVREILPLVWERSGSPQESFLGCALFNPTDYGGFHFGEFDSNAGLKLSQKEWRALQFDSFHPDFYLEAYRLAIEYNGRGHEQGDNPKRDRNRMNGYAMLGRRAFVFTRDELRTPGSLNKVARQIAMAIACYEGQKASDRFEALVHNQTFQARQQTLFDVYQAHMDTDSQAGSPLATRARHS